MPATGSGTTVPINLDDSGGTRFRNHDPTIWQRLNGVYFDFLAGVAVHLPGIVFPHNPLSWVILHNPAPTELREHIAVGKQPGIVNRARLHLPLRRTVSGDNREALL